MYILKQLYAGQHAAPERAEILHKLQHGGPFPFVYVLTRTATRGKLIDVYAVHDFRSEVIQRDGPLFTGIATGKKETFQVVQTAIAELYARNRTTSIDASSDTSDT